MPDTAALRTLWNYASERIAAGRIVAGYAVGFGGVAEALAKMAFGNGIGAEVELPEEALFAYDYGSIVVESTVELDAPFAVRLGRTTADEALTVNGERMPLDTLRRANSERFARIYPDRGANRGTVMRKAHPHLARSSTGARRWSTPWPTCLSSRARTATTTRRAPSAAPAPRSRRRSSATFRPRRSSARSAR
ncbi:MAG: AIR synthase-related protein [Alistipes communis]